MATQKKPQYKRDIAPAGPCGPFPNLVTPDWGSEKVAKPDGEWRVSVVYTADESERIRETVEAMTADHLAKVTEELQGKLAAAKTGTEKKKVKDSIEKLHTHFPWSEGVDDEGDEDGTFILKFSSKVKFKDTKTGLVKEKKMPLFDCSLPTPKEIKPESIWAGSVVAPAFDYMPYFVAATGMVGVKLRLNACQIVQLNSGGGSGGSASSFGFGGREDGHQADDDEGTQFSDHGTHAGDDDIPLDDNPNF